MEAIQRRALRLRTRTAIGLTLGLLMVSAAHAHNIVIPLAFWGGFDPASAHCQRVMSDAATRCANGVWNLERNCVEAQLGAGKCDMDMLSSNLQDELNAGYDHLDNACTDVELNVLQFLRVNAESDLGTFCQNLATALPSAVYLPAMHGGAIVPAGDSSWACMQAAGRVAIRYLNFAIRARRRALDRIATRSMPPSAKIMVVHRSTARIERARSAFAALLDAECPTFPALYGRDAATFLATVGIQADCLAGYMYTEGNPPGMSGDGVVCPPPVCGNGMQEPTEQCDDGNTTSGDGCSSTCTLEPGAP